MSMSRGLLHHFYVNRYAGGKVNVGERLDDLGCGIQNIYHALACPVPKSANLNMPLTFGREIFGAGWMRHACTNLLIRISNCSQSAQKRSDWSQIAVL